MDGWTHAGRTKGPADARISQIFLAPLPPGEVSQRLTRPDSLFFSSRLAILAYPASISSLTRAESRVSEPVCADALVIS